jgi:phosphoribosylformylglycinamidine synthase
MWSEHCSYKHSRRILSMYPTKGPLVLQGPGENAGGVRVGKDLAVLLKIESHNHPSFVEPYQGAATGVGGILRDIFTMGARPIALMDSLRFGWPRDPATRRRVAGVVAGIGGYGNCIGIPTVGGELEFDPCYASNCLVNAMAVGVIDPAHMVRAKARGPGNLVVYMGAATGRDGIHGASLMASREFGGERDKEGDAGGISAVQVADPFLGKLLMEASIELCRRGLLVGMQDMGAAGLTCSTCEMSAKGRSGMDVNLDLVPLRASGMTPYEILLSESQERMLLCVEPRRLAEVRKVIRRFEIPMAVIGKVTAGNRVRLRRHGLLVVDVPGGMVTDGVPLCPLPRPVRRPRPLRASARRLPEAGDPARTLLRLLSGPLLGSKKGVWEQYDHMVRTNTVVLPGSDAAVIRLKGAGKSIALSVDGPSRLCAADPFIGGQLAIAEAARNVACAGAMPLAFTNGLNFGNPDKPEVLWKFRECVRGIALGARKLKTPVVSGNVSFYNAHEGKDIYPTPMIGMLGLLDGWEAVPQWFRRAGDIVVLAGRTRVSLEASAYRAVLAGPPYGRPVPVSWKGERALQRALVAAARAAAVSSAPDVADGGLLVALAECCASGADATSPVMGCRVDLGRGATTAEELFGEGPSRAVISLRESCLPAFARAVAGVPWAIIGTVAEKWISVGAGGREVMELPVAEVSNARRRALDGILG